MRHLEKAKEDGRRHNRGTIGNRGGRKKGAKINPAGQRPGHQIRAYADEWGIIQDFAKLVKKDPALCQKYVISLKKEIQENQ